MDQRAILLAVSFLAVVTTAANARYACAVNKTPDGFVALRDGPSSKHKRLAKMRPLEMVGLLHPDKDDIVRSGNWLYVRWYPGTRRTAFEMPDVNEATARAGWVNDRLIDCFEE